jgi:hypothetical protein
MQRLLVYSFRPSAYRFQAQLFLSSILLTSLMNSTNNGGLILAAEERCPGLDSFFASLTD